MSRLLVIRLSLAAAAIAMLAFGGFIGLGWLVSSPTVPLHIVIGEERAFDLFVRYEQMSARLLPRDSDQDGVSDGLELFLRTDQSNPQSHPPLFVIMDFSPDAAGVVGDRKRWHPWCGIEGIEVPLAAGFRVTVIADEPVLLAPGALDSPAKGPLTLSVARNGGLDLDILATTPLESLALHFRNAATGEPLNGPAPIPFHSSPNIGVLTPR